MDKRELPAPILWAVLALAVIVAGYFLWSAGAPSRVTGGNPTPKDKEILRQMQEARQKAGAGRGTPQSGQVQPSSPASPP
jgi:hypothetical protein